MVVFVSDATCPLARLLLWGARFWAVPTSGSPDRLGIHAGLDQRATRNKKAHEPKFVGFLDNSW